VNFWVDFDSISHSVFYTHLLHISRTLKHVSGRRHKPERVSASAEQ
jgi:hypothetical protein